MDENATPAELLLESAAHAQTARAASALIERAEAALITARKAGALQQAIVMLRGRIASARAALAWRFRPSPESGLEQVVADYHEQAMESFSEALRLHPRDPAARVAMAECLMGSAKAKRALAKTAEQAQAAEASLSQSLELLGEVVENPAQALPLAATARAEYSYAKALALAGREGECARMLQICAHRKEKEGRHARNKLERAPLLQLEDEDFSEFRRADWMAALWRRMRKEWKLYETLDAIVRASELDTGLVHTQEKHIVEFKPAGSTAPPAASGSADGKLSNPSLTEPQPVGEAPATSAMLAALKEREEAVNSARTLMAQGHSQARRPWIQPVAAGGVRTETRALREAQQVRQAASGGIADAKGDGQAWRVTCLREATREADNQMTAVRAQVAALKREGQSLRLPQSVSQSPPRPRHPCGVEL